MSHLVRMLSVSFLEMFATILVERGVYFYSHHVLSFTDAANLWLALLFGATYVLGAKASHQAAARAGERRVLAAVVVAQIVFYGALAAWSSPVVLYLATGALGAMNGLKWPIIESYVSAGRDPKSTARAIGAFNVVWGATVPLSLLAAGPVIDLWPSGLFVLAASMNAASLSLVVALPACPPHVARGEAERAGPAGAERLRMLLGFSRTFLLCGYALMWILAAVLPRVLSDLAFGVRWAPALSGVMDTVRVMAFLGMGLWAGWHGRLAVLVPAALALPAGFFLAAFAPNLAAALGWPVGLAAVLAGEVLFGAAVGTIYTAALYYAMLAENASVAAGGEHEALIGSGFVFGPAAGLAGVALAPVLGGRVIGTVVGVAPLLLLCLAAAAWVLIRPRRS